MEHDKKDGRKHKKIRWYYYNPDDPNLWIERQMGIGYDLNFAHKSAWYMLAFLILFPLDVIVVPLLILGIIKF
jgi:uncharacterized membrane protein